MDSVTENVPIDSETSDSLNPNQEEEIIFESIKCTTCERMTPPVILLEDEKSITYKCLVCQNPFTYDK